MAAADTHVLVRLLVQDDAAQTRRAEAFLGSSRPLWISTVVLVETCWVLVSAYAWNRAQLAALLEGLQDSPDFVLQSPQAVREAVARFKASKADFPECLALELARVEGQLPFGTFDRAGGRLPGAEGL
ncbi:MAG: type II toxin-antitoxin system VapC family toxin [Holophagaceae bacterium]